MDLDPSILLFGFQFLQNLTNEVCRRDRSLCKWLTTQAREFEQIFDELLHFQGSLTYRYQVPLRVRRQVGCIVFEQDVCKTVDSPERGAQVMRNGITERFQFVVRIGKLAGTLSKYFLRTLGS